MQNEWLDRRDNVDAVAHFHFCQLDGQNVVQEFSMIDRDGKIYLFRIWLPKDANVRDLLRNRTATYYNSKVVFRNRCFNIRQITIAKLRQILKNRRRQTPSFTVGIFRRRDHYEFLRNLGIKPVCVSDLTTPAKTYFNVSCNNHPHGVDPDAECCLAHAIKLLNDVPWGPQVLESTAITNFIDRYLNKCEQTDTQESVAQIVDETAQKVNDEEEPLFGEQENILSEIADLQLGN